MSQPLWLTRMNSKAKARLLGKAHALIKAFMATNPKGGWDLQRTCENIWMLKSYFEEQAREGK